MSTLAQSPVSSASRPLPLRMRPDLVVAAQRIAGRRFWAIKDPITMTYFRLRDEEYAVLEMLDCQASTAEIIARFERRFAPRRLTPEHLQAFLARAHNDGLVVSDAAGQGAQLLTRRARERKRARLLQVSNLLAVRLPGLNPRPLLDALYPLVRGLLSKTAIVFGLSFVAAAIVLVITRFAQFEARLVDVQGFFTPRNAVFILLAVSLTKIVHELGHALACRHFGGECHEIGPMLLVFAPCLYCNVSDAWMFESKWRRIAVSAAGMYVEALLAAMATFVWWTSEPGLLGALCSTSCSSAR